ncbi:MAG: hypothetical protein M3Q66_03770 [Chloroflexota bacterium]|nr:hypothetical protein [Chloroflexota bacterium]
MRMARVVLVIAAIVTLVVGLIFAGSVLACLGPLGVTHVQCIAAFNATYDHDYAPGPAPGAWIAVAATLLLVATAVAPWRRPSLVAIVAIAAVGIAGALVGSVVYDLTRETSLTGPTSTGAVITVAFGPNTEARLLAAAVGFGVAIVGAAIVLRARLR